MSEGGPPLNLAPGTPSTINLHSPGRGRKHRETDKRSPKLVCISQLIKSLLARLSNMHSRTDEWTDGRTDGRTNRRTDRRTDGHMNVRTYICPYTAEVLKITMESLIICHFSDSSAISSDSSPFPPLPPCSVKNGLSQKRLEIETWGLWQSTRNCRFYIPILNICFAKS